MALIYTGNTKYLYPSNNLSYSRKWNHYNIKYKDSWSNPKVYSSVLIDN